MDVLEEGSAFGTSISPSLPFQVVVSPFQRFSTDTHSLLLRSLEIWVKASEVFGFFHQEVVPGLAGEGRQILLLL